MSLLGRPGLFSSLKILCPSACLIDGGLEEEDILFYLSSCLYLVVEALSVEVCLYGPTLLIYYYYSQDI